MTMTSWSEKEASGIRTRVLKFLKDHPNGRFLLTIHTHSDSATGQLCNSWNDDKTIALVNTIEEVCSYYLGDNLIKALKKHNGLRGLLLLACGSAVNAIHIESVKRLVQQYVSTRVRYLLLLIASLQAHGQFCGGIQRQPCQPELVHARSARRHNRYIHKQRCSMGQLCEAVHFEYNHPVAYTGHLHRARPGWPSLWPSGCAVDTPGASLGIFARMQQPRLRRPCG